MIYYDVNMKKIPNMTKSQNLLTLALCKKLQRKKFEEITVTELCEDAGVSRMSFYRCYNSIEDIFIKFTDERFEEFYEELTKIDNPTGYDFVHLIFKIMKKYSRQIKVLRQSQRDFILIQQFMGYGSYLKRKLDKEEIKLFNSSPMTIPFIAGGFYNCLVSWIDSDFKYSVDEMTHYIMSIFDI